MPTVDNDINMAIDIYFIVFNYHWYSELFMLLLCIWIHIFTTLAAIAGYNLVHLTTYGQPHRIML